MLRGGGVGFGRTAEKLDGGVKLGCGRSSSSPGSGVMRGAEKAGTRCGEEKLAGGGGCEVVVPPRGAGLGARGAEKLGGAAVPGRGAAAPGRGGAATGVGEDARGG